MSRQLLPPPGNTAFGIQNKAKAEFTWNEADLLLRMGEHIEVQNADSEGRIPSPASRAFTFAANLYQRAIGTTGTDDDDTTKQATLRGRKRLQVEARQTLRGLLATFALRDAVGLTIRPKSVRLNAQNGSVSKALLPALSNAPGGEAFWNPVRLYTIAGDGGVAEVFAGRSPFTGLFAAARAPRALAGLYWYAPPVLDASGTVWTRGAWHDPTDPREPDETRVPVGPRMQAEARRLLRTWLDTVLGLNLRQALQSAHGLPPYYANLLVAELEAWRDELPPVDTKDAPAVEAYPDDDFPLTSYTVREVAPQLLSDLPRHGDRLVVTAQDLRDPDARIYGQVRGNRHYTEEAVQRMPAFGDNLGVALDNLEVHDTDGTPVVVGESAAPVPYVLIDRLFTRYLSILTDNELAPEWNALRIEDEPPEYALYPLQPEALEFVSPEALRSGDAITATARDEGYDIRLTYTDPSTGDTAQVFKFYSFNDAKEAHVRDNVAFGGLVPNQIDLRFFPNFDLDPLQDLLPEDLAADRQYYARLRWLPYWNFEVAPFRYAAGTAGGRPTLQVGESDGGWARSTWVGAETPQERGALATGRARFFTFDQKPSGFTFSDRGFCLLDLEPVITDGPADEWEVGIDFGTSNTCVAYKSSDGAAPEILEFPIFTTTLLRRPNYLAGTPEVQESGAPALDFFYKYDAIEGDGRPATKLTYDNFFPTQFVTQQARMGDDAERADAQTKESFDIRRGLIHLRNLTSADPAMWQLIKSFPTSLERGDQTSLLLQRFSTKSNIKWKEVEWLRVFMHHLRKQVVLTAARRHARIKRVYFSYPKAFTLTRKRKFAADLKRVWGDVFGGTKDGAGLISESEAVRDYVVAGANEYVVFDVGGGTTDLIAFTRGTPVFQTSFELAAGAVTRYVAASPAFRKLFLHAFEDVMGRESLHPTLARLFEETPAIDDSRNQDMRSGSFAVLSQAWVDMLEQLSRKDGGEALAEVLDSLRDEAQPGGPAYGFFLTITLLFTGLAYLAGDLMKSAASGTFGQGFRPAQVTLRLTGNGSRLYKMLEVAEAPFRDTIVRMFRHGFGDTGLQVGFSGIEPYKNREAPKVTVALGLLSLNEHVGADATIPVVDVVGEDGGEQAGGNLFDYYRGVAKDPLAYAPPPEAPPELARFLNALDDALPYGRNGGFAVVAGAREDWADTLRTGIYRKAVSAINTRMTLNARKTNDLTGVPKDERPALEPLFVVELASMIDAVRHTYGS